MLTTEQKQKWVEALRSGEYKQGRACLRKGDAFCCLGVLAETMKVPSRTYSDDVISIYKFDNDLLMSATIPDYYLAHGVQFTLTRMNDGSQSTKQFDFNQIADWIEVNVKTEV